jgi:HSP20 family molecular chaperone IbpA
LSRHAHQTNIPVPRNEGASRIRTKSVCLKKPSGSSGSKGTENPEIYLWIGSGSLFVSADLRGFDLEDLQVRVQGARLIFLGTLRPDLASGQEGIHRAKQSSTAFAHALDLPYEVNGDEADVQNENGLISIGLKRKESGTQKDRLAQSSFKASLKRFFGENGDASHTLGDEITMLETLERYLDYHLGKGFAR